MPLRLIRFSIILVVVLLFVQLPVAVFCRQTPTVNYTGKQLAIGKKAYFFIDSSGSEDEASILRKPFKRSNKNIAVYQVTEGNIWIQFSIANQTDRPTCFFDLQYANITSMVLYKLERGGLKMMGKEGNAFRFDKSRRLNPNYTFELDIPIGDTAIYFLKINSSHPLLLPMFIQDGQSLNSSNNIQTIITGSYFGIILAMFFYNLFLFTSTRDKSYLFYILFLLFLCLAQLTVSGYTFKYLWPETPSVNQYAVTLTSSIAGIAALIFARFFLQINKYTPRLKLSLHTFICIYITGALAGLAGFNHFSYQVLNFTSLGGGIALIIISWYIAKRGYKPAYFYLVAWISFLLGMVIFVLRNLNILPYNNFTTYVLYIGSAIEVILLSIALADKINILRKEKEISQAGALEISRENERLVKEQNIVLERRVSARTEELSATNKQLTHAYQELKGAQIQLVEAEKMASLGQLTAGIAHEINNPINFVKSNIKPLQLDIIDLLSVITEYDKLHLTAPDELAERLYDIDRLKKQVDIDFVKDEIKSLMKGIEDGADRTAEIVRGLRNFSRLDESMIKVVNVHEGLESTLVLLRNNIDEHISVIKDFKAEGNIECYPGKLNQVFMNILSNSLQAIKSKKTGRKPEFLWISTRDVNEKEIEITIKDSGPGMSPQVRQKIFDPFFTTKEVGEGTGLGLAIVFKIIQEHAGKIDVQSVEGDGAAFVITLHHTIPTKANI